MEAFKAESGDEGEKSDVDRALEDVHRTIREGMEEREAMKAVEALEAESEAERQDAEAIEEVREFFRDKEPEDEIEPSEGVLYGDFEAERQADGRIVLEPEAEAALREASEGFRERAKTVSNLATGERIAADYATKTNNFRSQTALVDLPDGRKAYLLYDYPGSWLHRGLDGLMKRMNGIPMRKVGRGEMKARHAFMSTIPQIENGDPYMVAMPAVPNANAKDVFAHNRSVARQEGESDEAYEARTIADFASCDGWAGEAGGEEKLALAGKVMEEMRRFHGTEAGQRGWGEATLSNIIFTEAQEPVMCDFEVKYAEDVPDSEAQARDLKDMCMSIASAMEAAHGHDVEAVVHGLLDRYSDAEVIAEAKRLAGRKRGLLKNLFFGYEQARTGVSGKRQYDAVLAAIASYGPETSE